jgi:hypothetical protein
MLNDDSHMVTRWRVTYEYSGSGVIRFDSKEAKDRFVAELKESHTSASCEVEEIHIDRRQEVLDGMSEEQLQQLKKYADKRSLPLVEALDHLFKHYADG